jgi:cardiolipin synthase
VTEPPPPSSAPPQPWFRAGDDEVQLLRDGVEAFPAMLTAIAGAREEVLVEFYWITPDAVGKAFRDALTERAEAGVRVRVVYDSLGSAGMTPEWWTPLRDVGGEVWEYHPILPFSDAFKLDHVVQRDHRKLLVVDGRIGFTGGINLGDPWLAIDEGGQGWRDDMIAVRGEVVHEMRALFYRTWRRTTHQPVPDDVRPLSHQRLRPVFVLASQRRRRRNIHREYLVRFGAARSSIDIANAYFVPDRSMRKALFRAIARGVRVRVLFPMVSDVPGVQYAVEALFDTLLRHGVELYAMPPPMMHNKTAIVDERFVTIGSYNLDERSWRKNLEANVGVIDEAFARHVTESFDRDVARSTRIDLETWRSRSLARRGVEWVALALRDLW